MTAWVLSLWLMAHAAEPDFSGFQGQQMSSRLPQLPLQIEVFGSIFQTAYYFVDLSIGAPNPQSVSMIVDTGSSTQGIPCQDCEACGHAHWDEFYNRSQSKFNERMPCGECATCRLITPEDSLQALVAPLQHLVGNDTAFSSETAKLLLQDSERMQCLYHVHYAEGSSLSGLFYTDVVWLNIEQDHNGSSTILDAQNNACRDYPLSPGPSIPVIVPLGCHIEETHLFFDQKASGILGLEFWGNRGVPTFPSAVLDALKSLYNDAENAVMECPKTLPGENPSANEVKLQRAPEAHFRYAFSMCLSPQGGVMSFGAPNTRFHLTKNRLELGSKESLRYSAPVIVAPGKAPSYLIGLQKIRIAKNDTYAPDLNSTELYSNVYEREMWDEIELKRSAILHDGRHGRDKQIEVVPTLLDSGTTLTYMPARLFKDVLAQISTRVAANSARREKERNGSGRRLKRFPPERIFGSHDHGLVVRESLSRTVLGGGDTRMSEAATDTSDREFVEYIPLTPRPLLPTPKRLIRLATLESSNSGAARFGRELSESRKLQSAELDREDRLKAHILNVYHKWLLDPSSRSTLRRLQDTPPTWYAVLEPSIGGEGGSEPEDELVGFIDIPRSMEGAHPRSMISKLDGYNNGECWWLQELREDLPLFPTLAFDFYDNLTDVWHPMSYLYSGTNEHFWCLAIMTDGTGSAKIDEDKLDEEIIFGSNSFVHHDVVFNAESSDWNRVSDADIVKASRKRPGMNHYNLHNNATVYIVPAVCPDRGLGDRS